LEKEDKNVKKNIQDAKIKKLSRLNICIFAVFMQGIMCRIFASLSTETITYTKYRRFVLQPMQQNTRTCGILKTYIKSVIDFQALTNILLLNGLSINKFIKS
jgi:hypothetical protein